MSKYRIADIVFLSFSALALAAFGGATGTHPAIMVMWAVTAIAISGFAVAQSD